MDRHVWLRGYLAMLAIVIAALIVIPADQGLAFAIVTVVLLACAVGLQLDAERNSRGRR